jgi:hypothetical protein
MTSVLQSAADRVAPAGPARRSAETSSRRPKFHLARIAVRGAWRPFRAVLAWLPITWRGVTVLGLLYWLLQSLAFGRHDKVALGLCLAAFLLAGACMVLVFVSAVWLRVRRDPSSARPLRFAAGTPFQTGYLPKTMRWNPLVTVNVSWERPIRVDVNLVSASRRTCEEVTAHERALATSVVRKFVVSDLLGLARCTVLRRAVQEVQITPACGAVQRMQIVPQSSSGDQLPHPDGKPDGDLIEMRRYSPGDPLKLVLWKVYARTGRMLVRMPERTISQSQKTLAYFVAGPADEPTAGVARALVENGSLGLNLLFRADGSHRAAGTAAEVVAQIVASSAARDASAQGLADLLDQGVAQGVKGCILFVPAGNGPWLDRVADSIQQFRGQCRVIIGIDGLPPAAAAPAGPRRFLASHNRQHRRGTELAQICRRLSASGADVCVVDRVSGKVQSGSDIVSGR